jgi:16S rRNA (guanine966-N2)-methyltransferase
MCIHKTMYMEKSSLTNILYLLLDFKYNKLNKVTSLWRYAMRVISGVAKGKKLNTIEGNDTRPTTDRLKETLFNIISLDVRDCNFLDLFSGSGAIGIEALSRGAKSCYFIDNSKQCCEIINMNLKNTNLLSKANVIKSDCSNAISSINKTFDIIFIDAPYYKDKTNSLLQQIKQTEVLSKDGMIIVEQGSKDDLPNIDGIEIIKIKKFKTTTFVFIK